MEHTLFEEKLHELAQKYAVASNVEVNFAEGAIIVRCDKGAYRFYYDHAIQHPTDDMTNTPMMFWRQKRRYVELRNILHQELVKSPLAIRIHNIGPEDDFTATLDDVLFMEADLVQWIIGDNIERVFAAIDGGYMNCILSTKGDVKISMELGIVPKGNQPVLLHEVIGKTGILSDVVVDTQTQQYPIYVFGGAETKVYTDIDYELYGLSQSECDAVRFILWALSDSEHVKEVQEAAVQIAAVMSAAKEAARNIAYTPVKGGRLA